MLTVKIYSTNELNIQTSRNLSASDVTQEVVMEEGQYEQYLTIVGCTGHTQEIYIEEGMKVYVENLSGKTINVYKYSDYSEMYESEE